MKSTKGAILGYTPAPPPTDLPPSAQRYLGEELNRIAGVFANLMAPLRMLKLEPMMAEPTNPQPGLIAYASGPGGWDPGSGAGIYYYTGSIWNPLG